LRQLLLKRYVILLCPCRPRKGDQPRQTRMRQIEKLMAKNLGFASPHLPKWTLLFERHHAPMIARRPVRTSPDHGSPGLGGSRRGAGGGRSRPQRSRDSPPGRSGGTFYLRARQGRGGGRAVAGGGGWPRQKRPRLPRSGPRRGGHRSSHGRLRRGAVVAVAGLFLDQAGFVSGKTKHGDWWGQRRSGVSLQESPPRSSAPTSDCSQASREPPQAR
jgi:hypothetical protein